MNVSKTKFVNLSHTGFDFPSEIVYQTDNYSQNHFVCVKVSNSRKGEHKTLTPMNTLTHTECQVPKSESDFSICV